MNQEQMMLLNFGMDNSKKKFDSSIHLFTLLQKNFKSNMQMVMFFEIKLLLVLLSKEKKFMLLLPNKYIFLSFGVNGHDGVKSHGVKGHGGIGGVKSHGVKGHGVKDQGSKAMGSTATTPSI